MIREPILLVDDEEDLRSFLGDALREDGYQVDEAPDVRTALTRMSERHYPVVLTDLNMPGGPTGFELIAAVKARDKASLCVVITGYASMETAIQAVKFGAYDFVQKPFKLAEIEAVLDRALNHATVVGQLQDYHRDLEARVLARVKEIQDLHDEMRRLNALLVDAQCHDEEAPILEAFLGHLRERFHPGALQAYLPAPGDRWVPGGAPGADPAEAAWLATLPGPSRIAPWTDCARPFGPREGYLIRLSMGGLVLGVLFVGFQERSSFHPEAEAFVLWRRQLEAALHGLHRARAREARAVSRNAAP